MAVLPADSVQAVPECCQQLMLSPDSPIADLYSRDIPIDPNGKVLPWLWVVLLPFIDENRITSAVKIYENEMTDEEKKRNSFGFPLIFVDKDHPLGKYLDVQQQQQQDQQQNEKKSIYFDSNVGNGICGRLDRNDELSTEYGINQLIRAPDRPVRAFQNIDNNRILCLQYEFPEELVHVSKLLDKVDLGEKVLCDYDGIAHRPKLNKGKFNIADIAERMKDEKSRQSSQRMILGGLGMPTNMFNGFSQNLNNFQGGHNFNRNYDNNNNNNIRYDDHRQSSYNVHQSAEFQQYNRRNESDSYSNRSGSGSYRDSNSGNVSEYGNKRYSFNPDRDRYDSNSGNFRTSQNDYDRNYDRERDSQQSRSNSTKHQRDDRQQSDEYSRSARSSSSNDRYTQNSWSNSSHFQQNYNYNQSREQQQPREQFWRQPPPPQQQQQSWRDPPFPSSSAPPPLSSSLQQQQQQPPMSRAPPLPNMFSNDPRSSSNSNSRNSNNSVQIPFQTNYTNSRDPRMRR